MEPFGQEMRWGEFLREHEKGTSLHYAKDDITPDDLLSCVARIWHEDSIVGVGCFYRNQKKERFLVTAKHVAEEENPTAFSWFALKTVQDRKDAREPKVAQWKNLEKSTLLQVPEDVIAFHFNLKVDEDDLPLFLEKKRLVSCTQQKKLTIHQEAFMYCFPHPEGLPLVRSGHLATAPWENRPSEDANHLGYSHMYALPGDSGAPIFKDETLIRSVRALSFTTGMCVFPTPSIQLLGIHIGEKTLHSGLTTDAGVTAWLKKNPQDDPTVGDMPLSVLEKLLFQHSGLGVYVKACVLEALERREGEKEEVEKEEEEKGKEKEELEKEKEGEERNVAL